MGVVTADTPDVRFLTVRQAAKVLGFDRSYVARLCQDGKLDAIRDGRRYRLPESSVLAYLERPHWSRQGQAGKWVKVAEALRKLIANSQPGDRLPGLAALAEQYGTSFQPPSTAYGQLADEGLVHMVRGHGFYVSEPPGETPAATCLRCRMPDPPPEMTCTGGRDHRVGAVAGCPQCGRTVAACAARPCSARAGGAR